MSVSDLSVETSTMEDPFPEEVWDLILDRLKDPREAWKVFKAFPHLNWSETLQKKKRVWFFGLVIPHLFQWVGKGGSWIEKADLLNCRLACKQWSTSVEAFLEELPQFRAYDPDPKSADLLPGTWNLNPYLGRYSQPRSGFGGVDFHSENGPWIETFISDMGSHPPGRNPFLSRSLDIYLFECNDWETGDVNTLLQRFGQHVWFLELSFPMEDIAATLPLVQAFRYLANLRSLNIIVRKSYDFDPEYPGGYRFLELAYTDVQQFVDAVGNNLPPLEHLETLKLIKDTGDPNPLVDLLVTRTSTKIRRLKIDISFWKEEYSHLFPELTELNILQNDGHLRADDTMNAAKKLLSTLEAPQLSKAKIYNMVLHADDGDSVPLGIEDDIFQWLKRFPNMKYLEIGIRSRTFKTIEKGGLDPATDSHSSLEYLSIRSSFEMSYDFLRCLPSLQHLRLFVPPEPVVMDLSTNPAVNIKEQIQTGAMYESNVWEVLPKLRTLVLNDSSYVFTREGYHEHERKIREGLSSENEDRPLREDILSFLAGDVKRWNEVYVACGSTPQHFLIL